MGTHQEESHLRRIINVGKVSPDSLLIMHSSFEDKSVAETTVADAVRELVERYCSCGPAPPDAL